MNNFHVSDYFQRTFFHTYDAAILYLGNPVKLSARIGIACLPEPSFNTVGLDMIISGWGSTTPTGSFSAILKAATVRGIPLSQCMSSYPNEYLIDPEVCATSSNGDFCQGDIGGERIKVLH